MTIRALAHPHRHVTHYVPHYKTSSLFMQFLLIMHCITTYRLGTIVVERASEGARRWSDLWSIPKDGGVQ